MCPGTEIVPFGSVLYGCYLLDILDVWDILDVLLGCLCVDVIVNIWMFIYGCYVWMCKMCKCAKRAKCDYVQNVQNVKNYTNTKNYIVSVIIKCAKCLDVWVGVLGHWQCKIWLKKKSLITFCIFSYDTNNVIFFYSFYY